MSIIKFILCSYCIFLKKFFASTEIFTSHCIFIFGIIYFIIAFYAFDGKAEKIEVDLSKGDFFIEKFIQAKVSKDSVNLGLFTQFNYLKYQKKQYLETARSYEVLYFTCSCSLVFFSTITGILTFVLARRGWDLANGIIKVSFLTCAFLSTLVAAIPKVFDHEKNATNNISKYFTYSKLQMEIFNYICIPGIQPDSVKSKKRMEVFNKVNQAINESGNLYINLSPLETTINSELFKNLEKNNLENRSR